MWDRTAGEGQEGCLIAFCLEHIKLWQSTGFSESEFFFFMENKTFCLDLFMMVSFLLSLP